MFRAIGKLTDFRRRRESKQILRGLSSRYQIERELGQGGMAVVFLALDRQLRREVAIKVLHPTLSLDRDAVVQLSHEARLVAQVQHPNIVAIHDIESLEDGGVALVMQYVRGHTLRTVIDDGRQLPVSTIERVLEEIASALSVAHRRGIVHRDVKPENIYIDEESGRALLADFGIASAPRLGLGLTLGGEALGTPNYMSPEQIAGEEMDGRSDLYSLGLLGYEMVSGKRPWAGESLYQILHSQQHEYLPSLTSHRSDIPLSLEHAVEQALRKDRSFRPSSADEFLSLLRGRGRRRYQPAERTESLQTPPEPPAREPGGGNGSEYSPVAPTVRYDRSAPHGSGSERPPKDGDTGAAGRSAPDSSAFPDVPFWVDGGEAKAREEPREKRSPEQSSSPSRPVTIYPTSHPSRGSRGQGGRRSRYGSSRPSWVRNGLVIIAGSSGVALVIVGIGTMAMSPAPAPAGDPPDSIEVAAEPAQPDPVPSEGRSSAGPAPPPVRASGGGGGSGSPRVASETYERAGDITDIFCSPRGEETEEEWRARVPAYCIDQL